MLIKDKETNEDIGTSGLKNIDHINMNAELFISIGNAEYCNTGIPKKRGYGTDAVKTSVRFSFDVLNLHNICLHVFKENERAIAC